jgi:hypothetical protein
MLGRPGEPLPAQAFRRVAVEEALGMLAMPRG